METNASARTKTIRIASLAAVLISCTCLLAALPLAAWAADGVAGKATLQVSRGLDEGGALAVDVCTTFDFYPNATIEDLLTAAKDNGDIASFELSYGFPASVTFPDGQKVENAADWSTYWSSAIDGNTSDAAFSSGDYTTIKLEDGKTYQLVLDSYPSVVDDWGVFGTPKVAEGIVAGTAPNTSVADKDDTDSNKDSDNVQEQPSDGAGDDDSAKGEDKTGDQAQDSGNPQKREVNADDLFENIASSYAGTKFDWNAMDLGRAGRATADMDALVQNALAAAAMPDSGSLQRSILALTANGIDPTKVPSADGSVDLVAALAGNPDAYSTAYASIPAFTLLAYESGPYDVPSSSPLSKNQLVGTLAGLQNADGTYGYGDVDTTAMVVAALAPYYGTDAAVKTSVDAALDALHGLQLASGGFGTKYGSEEVANANSTAMVVIALSALGVDANAVWQTDAGTPYSTLLEFATDDLTAFTYDGTAAMESATEQGFRALVAYRGFVNRQGAFNVYTDTVASEKPIQPAEPAQPTGDDTPAQTTDAKQDGSAQAKSSSSTPAASSTTSIASKVAATGDDAPVLPLCCLAAIAALLCAASARKTHAGTGAKDAKEHTW